MISCREAVKQLWDFVEGDVGGDAAARIEEHLGVCRRCCGEVEFAEELRRFLAGSARPAVPGEVQQRLETFLLDLERS